MKIHSRSMRFILFLCVLSFMFIQVGCTTAGNLRNESQTLLQQLKHASLSYQNAGASYSLKPYYWRDFIPDPEGRDPGGSGMMFTITFVNGLKFKGKVGKIICLLGSESFEAETVLVRPTTQSRDILIAHKVGGPKWPAGSTVTCGIELTDVDGKTVLLKAPPAQIEQTE